MADNFDRLRQRPQMTDKVTLALDPNDAAKLLMATVAARKARTRADRTPTDGAATATPMAADSVRVTVKDPRKYWTLYSTRGALEAEPFDYPIESGTVPVKVFPDAAVVRSDNRDTGRTRTLVFVHGYNAGQAEFEKNMDELYKRLFWVGFRGNVVGFTWTGDEFTLPLLGLNPNFDGEVENAFQTAPKLRGLLRGPILTGAGGNPENVDVMAHSLGVLLTHEALRLQNALEPGTAVANDVISFEGALWEEVGGGGDRGERKHEGRGEKNRRTGVRTRAPTHS